MTVQPSSPCSRRTTPYARSSIAPAAASAPPRSKPPFTRGGRGSFGTSRSAASRIAAASRTGAKKTQRQPSWVSSPPMTRPREKPPAAVPAKTRSAWFRCGPSSYEVVMIDRAAGVMKAAATPVTKRARIRVQPVSARPPRPEKTRKTVSQPRNIRRRPSRSAARPPRRV
ncbi:hypothetical protein STANM309S_01511 [Streptomyces tanashiensis]